MTPDQLEQTLTIIARQAKGLRDVGVVGRVTIGEVSFELAEADPAPASERKDEGTGNPLDDGDTFGGEVPRRRVELYSDDAGDDEPKE